VQLGFEFLEPPTLTLPDGLLWTRLDIRTAIKKLSDITLWCKLRLNINLLRAVTLSNFSDIFPTSVRTFQLHRNFPTSAKLKKKPIPVLSFARFFPTSIGSFQLQSVLSNFAWFFPTSLGSFQLQRNFPTALSNYTHPAL